MKMIKVFLPSVVGGALAWSLGGGAVLAAFDTDAGWWGGWLAYSVLLAVAFSVLRFLDKKISLPKKIQYFAKSVFWLRLGLGVALMMGLPIFGYQDSQASIRGYLFQDSYRRDRQSWALAVSEEPIYSAFDADQSGDQYGGLLALSAATYRFLSPGVHRPYLILIWIALAGAVSTAIFWKVIHIWLSLEELPVRKSVSNTAVLATAIFALYPEAVLLGSSHMREALVILGIVVMFWGFVQLSGGLTMWWVNFFIGGSLLLVFQPPLAFATTAIILLLWLLEPAVRSRRKTVLVFAAMLVAALVIMVVIWGNLPSLSSMRPGETILYWLQHNINFQSHLSERASGMLQKLLRTAGGSWTLPIILGYGAAQPVLPATLIDPAAGIWRVINSFRAAGWYILAPMMAYATLTALRSRGQHLRWQAFWLGLVCGGWILVSAAVAGGDQWDNPRYRTLFLPWMAFLAAWGWTLSRKKSDPWLVRLWIAEAICVVIFLQWYISRYYPALIHFDVRFTIGITALVVVGYLIISLGWDFIRRKRQT
jgi:hypothetical protein